MTQLPRGRNRASKNVQASAAQGSSSPKYKKTGPPIYCWPEIHSALTDYIPIAAGYSPEFAKAVEGWRDSPSMIPHWEIFDSWTPDGAMHAMSTMIMAWHESEIAVSRKLSRSKTKARHRDILKAADKLLKAISRGGWSHYGIHDLQIKFNDRHEFSWEALLTRVREEATKQAAKGAFHPMPSSGPTARRNAFVKLFLYEFRQGLSRVAAVNNAPNAALYRAIAEVTRLAYDPDSAKIDWRTIRVIYRDTPGLGR